MAFRYVEHDTIHPIVFICTARWAKIYIAYSRQEQGKLKSMMSISDVGRDRPTAFEPKSMACEVGNKVCMKNLTRSKETIL